MDLDRAHRLLTLVGLSGYDPASGTYLPWHRLGRYTVEFQTGRGIARLRGLSIRLPNPADQCPHVIVHSFVHEVAHVRFLYLDLAVLALVLPEILAMSWYLCIGALALWNYVWRELVADAYAIARIGFKNTWRGYAHFNRRRRPS